MTDLAFNPDKAYVVVVRMSEHARQSSALPLMTSSYAACVFCENWCWLGDWVLDKVAEGAISPCCVECLLERRIPNENLLPAAYTEDSQVSDSSATFFDDYDRPDALVIESGEAVGPHGGTIDARLISDGEAIPFYYVGVKHRRSETWLTLHAGANVDLARRFLRETLDDFKAGPQ